MSASGFRTRRFGWSAEGRPLLAFERRSGSGSPRVLVLAGQHGDETLPIEVLENLVGANLGSTYDGLDVAVVPCANPDGRARGTRTTREGLDLNRDHLELRTPEARFLHRYARFFGPALIVDVHSFKARRRALSRLGLEHAADVLLEARTGADPAWVEAVCARIERLSGLAEAPDGLRAGRYFVARGERARTSSVDLVDARNGLAGSMEAFGVLVEGREPTRRLGTPARTRAALARAIEVVVDEWRRETAARPPTRVVTDARRADPSRLAVWTRPKGGLQVEKRWIEVESVLDVRCEAVLPKGYLVPSGSPLLDALARHGHRATAAPPRMPPGTEAARIHRIRRSRRPGAPLHRLRVEWEPAPVGVDDSWLFFSAAGPRGAALARLLEPSSRYGLHRLESMGLMLGEGDLHPVLRLPALRGPRSPETPRAPTTTATSDASRP